MRRLPVLLCALALAGAACSNDGSPPPPTSAETTVSATTPSPSIVPSPTPAPSTTTTTTTTATPSPTPTTQPDVDLPSGMTDAVDDPDDLALISAGDLGPLVPAGSTPGIGVVFERPGAPIDQIAVTWRAGATLPGRTGLI